MEGGFDMLDDDSRKADAFLDELERHVGMLDGRLPMAEMCIGGRDAQFAALRDPIDLLETRSNKLAGNFARLDGLLSVPCGPRRGS